MFNELAVYKFAFGDSTRHRACGVATPSGPNTKVVSVHNDELLSLFKTNTSTDITDLEYIQRP